MTAKVLIVDDIPDNIDLLRRVLSPLDCTTLVATNGLRALELIEKNRPDLVLLDVMMPEMDGFEVCRRLRENPVNQDLPILFVTGRQDDIRIGFEAGGNDYITKPVNTDEVLARVAHHLERVRLLHDLKTLNIELEDKVRERTAKLALTNRQLREEVHERRYMQDRLRYLAEHDFVTRQYNRNALDAHITDVIAKVQLEQHSATFLQIDLDRFRLINESCGCVAGDELLRECSELIALCLGRDDFLARIGGDRFGLVTINRSVESAQSLARLIKEQFAQYRFHWEDREFSIDVTIGILAIDQRIQSFEQLLIMADELLYLAKKEGGHSIRLYDEETTRVVNEQRRINWALKLLDALKYDHFEVFVQHIVPSDQSIDRTKVRLEALIRLNDPKRDHVLTPDLFMPAAERFNLMPGIDRWMIDHVCQFIGAHPKLQVKLDSIAINLSATTLTDTHLADFVAATINQYGIEPRFLSFEITETERFINLDVAKTTLNALSELGCALSIDDFGSGYASFNYLRELPFNEIKIDGVFIKDLDISDANLTMVKSILDIAKQLNKPVVAEFVERHETLEVLNQLGVSWCQGYLFHRPERLTPDVIVRLLEPQSSIA